MKAVVLNACKCVRLRRRNCQADLFIYKKKKRKDEMMRRDSLQSADEEPEQARRAANINKVEAFIPDGVKDGSSFLPPGTCFYPFSAANGRSRVTDVRVVCCPC